MLSENRIKEITNKAKKEFNIDFELKFIPYQKFKEIAKKSPLITQVLAEGFTFSELKIPALIYHEEKEHVYMCKSIIKSILSKKSVKQQEDFIKAVIYHEVFHIMEKTKIGKISFMKCLKQEERICRNFKKRFPELYSTSKKIHEEASSRSM
ncbi:hypothetical protein HYT58_00880 [Candidatus Woesearchaeota archaeon]|nr:hypothetical protein [Candidatus Woesearchaeota archaeon]